MQKGMKRGDADGGGTARDREVMKRRTEMNSCPPTSVTRSAIGSPTEDGALLVNDSAQRDEE
jgi:hypothetical protein